MPGEWVDEGLCGQTDPEIFFPGKEGSTAPAKRVCAACPVLAECRAWAIPNEVYGIWGGLSEQERRKARSAARKARAAA